MLIVFVHGWSVTNTDTCGGLPAALVKNASPKLDLQVTHLYLSKYVSFEDEVKVDDIARGMAIPATAYACFSAKNASRTISRLASWERSRHRPGLLIAPTTNGSETGRLEIDGFSERNFAHFNARCGSPSQKYIPPPSQSWAFWLGEKLGLSRQNRSPDRTAAPVEPERDSRRDHFE